MENAKEVVAEFEERLNVRIRRQKKSDQMEKRDFKRRELPVRYLAKILYRWDDKKFENKYLRKLEKNWQKWKLVSLEKKP